MNRNWVGTAVVGGGDEIRPNQNVGMGNLSLVSKIKGLLGASRVHLHLQLRSTQRDKMCRTW